VIVHGLGGSIQDWLPAARILAKRHRVTLVQLPGHGQSPMPEPFTLSSATRELDRTLAEQPGPVVLVGHSLGGLVAASETLAHPERVRALVLIETALRPQFVGEERDRMLEAMEQDFDGLLHAAYQSFGRDSAQGEALYAAAAANDPRVLKRWIRLALDADLSQRAEKLGVPMLAILADRSWPVDEPWNVTATALGYDDIPDVRGMRLMGCGHFVMRDRPAAVAQAIARFGALPDGEPMASRDE